MDIWLTIIRWSPPTTRPVAPKSPRASAGSAAAKGGKKRRLRSRNGSQRATRRRRHRGSKFLLVIAIPKPNAAQIGAVDPLVDVVIHNERVHLVALRWENQGCVVRHPDLPTEVQSDERE